MAKIKAEKNDLPRFHYKVCFLAIHNSYALVSLEKGLGFVGHPQDLK
jgi:hypothetical protein